jgi:hypothetical protein
MEGDMTSLSHNQHGSRGWTRTRILLAGLLLSSFAGCSAFHPVRGVPASYVPVEYQGPHRGDKRTIDLSLLVRTPPDQHRVAAGDVLSIYIPGVLGRASVEFNAEVGVDPPINTPQTNDYPPTIGFPIQVRDDHTISLPQIPPLNVHGMTLHEVELALRQAYTVDRQIVKTSQDMILVSLQRPREYRVLVVRQEANLGGGDAGGSGAGNLNVGSARRGTARMVRLKAYENDVLHALSDTAGVDGLPGLDAENTIYIIRRRGRNQSPSGSLSTPQPTYAPAPSAEFPTSEFTGQRSPIQPVANWQTQQADPVHQAYYQTANPRNAGQYAIGLTGHSFAQPGPSTTYPQQSFSTPTPTTGYSQGYAYGTPSGGHSWQGMPGQPGAAQQVQYMAPQPELMASPDPGYGGHSLQYGQPAVSAPTAYPNSSPLPQSGYSNPLPPAPQFAGVPAGDYSGEWSSALGNLDSTIDGPNVVKIPVRLAEGQVPRISEEDITLYDGDIVFIESRETEVFYTGGLLGGGQYTLPRDYDLRVLEALSIAESRNAGGGGQALRSVGGVSALNRDVAFSASRVAILRTLPNGQRVTIEVDINKAMKYQEENILVQPGDMLILQYTLIGIATSSFTGGGGGN